ncbi:hypothetical protein E4N77_06850 [Treponema denticola]|nr:hypothetical protein E4N77_06850 [Treponema denticola]
MHKFLLIKTFCKDYQILKKGFSSSFVFAKLHTINDVLCKAQNSKINSEAEFLPNCLSKLLLFTINLGHLQQNGVRDFYDRKALQV